MAARTKNPTEMPIKCRVLQLLDEKGAMWDYELWETISKEYGISGDYWKSQVKLLLIELASGGLTSSVEQKVDDGTYFGEGAVLYKYQIEDFGRERAQQVCML
jgi:hypothetical protein